jgi:hypothetical protein
MFPHLFSSEGYVKDLMRQYGDRGRPLKLPERHHNFEKALQFRNAEKRRFFELQDQLHARTEELAASQKELGKFAVYINKFLKEESGNGSSRVRRSGGDARGDGRDNALSSKDNPDAHDTHSGTAEEIISRHVSSNNNESADARVRGTRNDNGDTGSETASQKESANLSSGHDAGGAPPEQADRPESDVGGPSTEHDTP